MDIKQLDQQVSVSDLCGPEAMPELAAAGVEVLVCNRTEGEVEDLPSFAELRQAAEAHGMEFVAIPFARGQMNQEHCEQFRQVLASGKRVHAFCRTGNRSCNLWAGAKCLAGEEPRTLVAQAGKAGFDVSGVVIAFSP
ncbi:TIGR01244 family sulfur transferase [Microbulbifer yueqingensis]|uniref:Sulfide:quinone oxidoreductase n=1 Tax=Microbulbifer yueqingensis TaxID=658219 RepID=A0A1G9AG67_9GAMM|nr:TIGR01244 family sulfur transferase [Microbulbifer yueqingensis]SDK25794.1 sulfide:quinone oxidoreductase [Microbulbifer yueqingensis]